MRRRALDPQSADQLTTTAYYPDGQVRRTTNAGGATTDIALDGMDRVVQTGVAGTGLPFPLVSAFTYDGNGNRITERDPRGVERRTTFDALNQPTQVEITTGPGAGPTGVVSRATYDAVGNKATETDLAGLVTSFEHDLLYRVKRKTLPESGPAGAYFEEYEYDLAGNLTLRRDANGHERTFGYDGHNRRDRLAGRDGPRAAGGVRPGERPSRSSESKKRTTRPDGGRRTSTTRCTARPRVACAWRARTAAAPYT